MELEISGGALVTGGSRGIGAAIARALAAEGCRVAITHRGDTENAARLARELGGFAVDADAADGVAAREVVRRADDDLGGLSILVCNAGVADDAVVWKMADDQWERVLAVNLGGAFHYCRAAAPLFRARKKGKIVLVASINGLRGKFGQSNYAASKGGLIAFGKTLARELGPSGVNVNVVAPGLVMTDMTRDLPPRVLEAAVAESVLGRAARPEDVADAVAFLCSARARHVTGTVLRVDGGQCI